MDTILIEAAIDHVGGYQGDCQDIADAAQALGLWGEERKQRDYEFLFCLAREVGGPVLEQGAAYGLSTRYLHRGLEAHVEGSPTIFSVDTAHKWGKHLSVEGYPNRVQIDGPAEDVLPPDRCMLGFEDALHTYDCTFRCLEKQIKAGSGVIVVHDTAAWMQHAFGDVLYGCRQATLDFFEARPFDLLDIRSDTGMMLAIRRDSGYKPFEGPGSGRGPLL
jgi:hypothetical protein